MNHTTTEVQPLDDCYAAFIAGGTLCLVTSLMIALLQLLDRATVSRDGSGLAILLLVSAGTMLVNRGCSGRLRLRSGIPT